MNMNKASTCQNMYDQLSSYRVTGILNACISGVPRTSLPPADIGILRRTQ